MTPSGGTLKPWRTFFHSACSLSSLFNTSSASIGGDEDVLHHKEHSACCHRFIPLSLAFDISNWQWCFQAPRASLALHVPRAMTVEAQLKSNLEPVINQTSPSSQPVLSISILCSSFPPTISALSHLFCVDHTLSSKSLLGMYNRMLK